jgi:ribosomal protein L11 methyltransferase
VLDLGCGTGILGLAARKLGAREVLGIDYDPKAVAVARANARRNGVRGAVFRREDLFKWTPPGRFDVILANIFADVLTAALPRIRRAVAAGGTVVLSGILDSSAPAVLEEGRRVGLEFRQVLKRGKWVTAVGGAAGRGRPAGRRPA